MKSGQSNGGKNDALRRRAEAKLPRPAASSDATGDPQALLHELQVHQVELEMQNAELERARNQLEITLEKYTDLYDFAPVGYFTLDQEGAIRDVNLAGAALLGQERGRLIDQRFGLFVAEPARRLFADLLRQLCAEKTRAAFELALASAAGPAHVQVQAAGFAREPLCRLAVIDITDRKRIEDALCRARDDAEAANRAKSFFLANMSHEIRTPMNAIVGFSELLLQETVNARQRQYLGIIQTRSHDLLLLINDILDLSRIEADRLVLACEDFSPASTVDEVLLMFSPVAAAKGLRLERELSARVPAQSCGDPRRLRQVLVNLVGNAIKFTRAGAVTVSVDCESADQNAPGGLICFAVRDTGAGVPADKLELIFKPFTQADETSTRSHGGAGLGLTIARRLVEKMGGRLWVESVLGKGSVFHFTVRLPPAAGVPAPDPGARIPDPAASAWRILAVEDDAASAVLIAAILERCHHQVTVAVSGSAALACLARENFDLMLLDISLPDMDGYALTRMIRQNNPIVRDPRIPVIAVTACAMIGDDQRCRESGMNSFVSKPVSIADLLTRIEEVMAAR